MKPIAGRGTVDREVFGEAGLDREVRNSVAFHHPAGDVTVTFEPHSALLLRLTKQFPPEDYRDVRRHRHGQAVVRLDSLVTRANVNPPPANAPTQLDRPNVPTPTETSGSPAGLRGGGRTARINSGRVR